MASETFGVRILEIVDNDDGTCTLKLDLPDEFVEAFNETFELDVFSEETFNKFFVEAITEYLDEQEHR